MKFEVGEQIGQGGGGVVHRAHHLDLDRALAIKYIHPHLLENADAVERFLREAKLTARLEHPNIVRVWDAGRDESGRLYILMDLLEGESLRQRLRRGRLSEEEALDVAEQVLSGLAEAHAKGIVHRDIKPANIYLNKGGVVKILDFGIAKAFSDNQMTRTGLHIGTPEYMSPEQANGTGIDHRTDLYSVGIVLYEMVSGYPPFRADTPASLLYKHVHVPIPAPPADCSRRFRASLDALLAKNPADRPQTAQEALAVLEGRSPARTLRGETTMLQTFRRPLARAGAIFGGAVVVIGLGIAGFRAYRSSASAPDAGTDPPVAHAPPSTPAASTSHSSKPATKTAESKSKAKPKPKEHHHKEKAATEGHHSEAQALQHKQAPAKPPSEPAPPVKKPTVPQQAQPHRLSDEG